MTQHEEHNEPTEVLCGLLAEFPDRQAWVSFSARDGRHVAHGEPFAECAARVAACPQVIAVGVNCTAPENVAPLLAAAAHVGIPLAAYPNSGERWDAGAQRWHGEVCAAMDVAQWYRLGARLVGGCCRTTSRDVAAMRRILSDAAGSGMAIAHGKAQDRVVE